MPLTSRVGRGQLPPLGGRDPPGLHGMQARGELGRADPDELALATLAAVQGGPLLA